MYDVEVGLDPAFTVGSVDPRLYGSFVEHMGRCVYGGIFEPDHPTADEHGFRRDVADLVRELGVTTIRYPGGNFVSGYRWEDGVGPVAERPRRLDLAWRSLEPNTVGTDEFCRWARGVGIDPIMAVNLGTRGVDAAVDLLEYANFAPGSTSTADRRVANGHKDPHGVRTWCLGNEMDGPWQVGHKTADEYGRLAAETARAMRRADPDLELVACGSSNSGMPTFGSWERTVLEHTYDLVDHISLHAYYEPVDGDVDSFLASSEDMRSMITAIAATADHVGAVRRSGKRLTISFDEWNVWYQRRFSGQETLGHNENAPLIEDVYDVTDAVVVGDLLMALLDHCDRVAIACQAQLVNVIAPILTRAGGPAWRQTIFHPFALTARHARGTVLRAAVRTAQLPTQRYGEVPATRVTAVQDPETGALTLLAANRNRTEPARLTVPLRAFGRGARPPRLLEHLAIAEADPSTTNTAEHPDRVVPRPVDGTVLDGDRTLTATLPPSSWHLIRLGH